MSEQDIQSLKSSLLEWYDRHRRVMPWRAEAGMRPDPYAVWLSEIMLQQTTVVTVGPYFRDFIARWPTVSDLAAADLDAVLHAWAGLGYYARARNLHKCAQAVAAEHDGVFPDTKEALAKLPGIGAYTSSAIASIAFDRAVVPVDGNVERVLSRLRRIETPLPLSKDLIKAEADRFAACNRSGGHRSGDFAQALMDLGATVCTPKKPKCLTCPWRASCSARIAGIAETLPAKMPKKEKPTRRAVAFWAVGPNGEVLLRRRPEKGLLGGMMEIPSSDWMEGPLDREAALAKAPVTPKSDWEELPGIVRHTFTHFHFEITVMAARTPRASWAGVWVPVDRLDEHALPTVMKKIVRHALSRAGRKAA
ncbi:MAG: A/G-specific adenine glycosylase [Alphaproteobacteria bacterium]|nr:A/G-specific adenine glycosylase [Alphaproteobacteria bacterium]